MATTRARIGAGIAALAAVSALTVALSATGSGAAPVVARAVLHDVAGREVGQVRFTPNGRDSLLGRVTAELPLDSAPFHGFHIHANDPDASGERPGCRPETGFASVGGHWDVGGHGHGAHTGDLPSLVRQADGDAEATFVVDNFTAASLVGRAVVVHVGPDNFGNVPLGPAANQYTDNGAAYDGPGGTAATGNAGARYACGVIARR